MSMTACESLQITDADKRAYSRNMKKGEFKDVSCIQNINSFTFSSHILKKSHTIQIFLEL